jgi:3',5'-cyclic AMP phosphodiesterase CpdA
MEKKNNLRMLHGLLIILLLNIILGAYHKKLKFNNKGEFKILQITDIHYGEGWDGDFNTTRLMENLISYANPDAAIITGDAVSGYSWDGLDQSFYQGLWANWTTAFNNKSLPYIYTLGNHDDQGNYNRKSICDLDTQHNFSMIQYNPFVTGATNYWVPIYSHDEKEIVSIMWLLDTNDVTCHNITDSWGCLNEDQIEWFEKETLRIEERFGYVPQGMAWFHIPLPEYRYMHNWEPTYLSRNEDINCSKFNTGFFEKILKLKNINAIFCGHDHNNDEGGFLLDVELAYGRKTGYGGYGPYPFFQRGARVITLKEKYDSKLERTGFTYSHNIIQEDGTFVENGYLTWKGDQDYVDSCQNH